MWRRAASSGSGATFAPMHEFEVKVSTYGDEPDTYSSLATTAREAAMDALAQLDRPDADYLAIAVEPVNPDAPPIPPPAGGEDPWEDVEADEVAVNPVTGDVARWHPDVVAHKGGLASPWVWLTELSVFEAFELLYLRRRRPAE
jgi:hypothetical protein